MNLLKHKRIWIGGFFALIIACVLAGLIQYNHTLKYELSNSACDTMTEISAQQKFNFDSEISSQLASLELVALMIGNLSEPLEQKNFLNSSILNESKFEHIMVINMDGKGQTDTGETVDVSKQDYFIKARDGLSNLGWPVLSQTEGKSIVPVAVPIYQGSDITGVLVGTYSADKLSRLILPSYGGRGYAFIVDSSGNIITNTSNDDTLTDDKNLFTFWEHAEFIQFDNREDILEHVDAGIPGHTVYKVDDNVRLCHYAPLNYNDWYIFVVVSQSVISSHVNRLTSQTAILAMLILTLSLLLVAYILVLQNKAEREHKDYLENLERIAYYDDLTGLPTLSRLKDWAQNSLDLYPEKSFLLVKLDVTKFKMVNQIYGYSVGNQLLCEISESLKENLKSPCDCCAKVNIDEFVMFHEILPEKEFDDNRSQFISRLTEKMEPGFHFNLKFPAGHYVIKAGIEKRDINDAIEKVNFAHREAKRTQQDVCLYNAEIASTAFRHQMVENRMDLALNREEFLLYLQPKYSLESGEIAGAEALVRWSTDEPSLFYPGSFIPVFETCGFISKLDMYMFEKTCKTIGEWIKTGIKPVAVSVNFSRLHLNNPDFISQLCRLADQYSIPRHLLEIELTESSILENKGILLNVLVELHQAGFTCSMDDFGSGYSSLGLLKDIPVDVIKIDRAFFDQADLADRATIVIKNVLRMARELGIHTVAEGVEVQEQIDFLKTLNCDMVQGFYFAKPMPEPEFRKKLPRETESS